MKKYRRISIRRAVELGMVLGVIGLFACDEGPVKDRSVFELDESQTVPTESAARNLPVPDPGREAILEVLRDADAFSRARRLGTLLPKLGPGPVQQVRTILTHPEFSFYIGSAEIELLTRYWATHDPEGASTWAVEKSPLAFRTAAVVSALTLWAKADPSAALEASELWMERRDVRDFLLTALIFGWYSGGDPPELQTFLRELGVSFNRQRALSAYIRTKLRSEGAEAVMRWAEAIPGDDPRYKLAAYRQVGIGVALDDIDSALRWCEAHCGGPYGAGLSGMVGRGWMQHDPSAALKWLSNSTEDDEARFALRVAFSSWALTDRDAAMQWMSEQAPNEPPTALIPTYPIYARLLAQDSPVRAVDFAELILDKADREALLIEIATVWRAQDQAACDAWLEQSPLSERAREKVRGEETPASDLEPVPESPQS